MATGGQSWDRRAVGRSSPDGRAGRWLVVAAVCLVALAAPAAASAQLPAPGQVIFPSPAGGATVASPVEIVYAHNPACEEDHPAYDTPYGQNMLPPQVVNVATGRNEMELSPGIGRRIVGSPAQVGLDSVYVTAFEYGGTSPIPRRGVQRTERIVMGLPNGTYEVRFTLFVPCAGTSDVLRFTVGAAPPSPTAPTAPSPAPCSRTLERGARESQVGIETAPDPAAVERVLRQGGQAAIDFLTEDLRTLQDPSVPDWEKGLIVASYAAAPESGGTSLAARKVLFSSMFRKYGDDVIRWLQRASDDLAAKCPGTLQKVRVGLKDLQRATMGKRVLRAKRGLFKRRIAAKPDKLATGLHSHTTKASRPDKGLRPKVPGPAGAKARAIAQEAASKILDHPEAVAWYDSGAKVGQVIRVTLPPGKGFDPATGRIVNVATHQGLPFTVKHFQHGIGVQFNARTGEFVGWINATKR